MTLELKDIQAENNISLLPKQDKPRNHFAVMDEDKKKPVFTRRLLDKHYTANLNPPLGVEY